MLHGADSVFSANALSALKSDLAGMLNVFWDDSDVRIRKWSHAIEVLINPTAGFVLWLLLMIVPASILALDALRAFPEVPAILFATLQEQFKLSDADAQASFRQDFSQHFDDVVLALHPTPLVVFVDDIDRCTKENAMEMLEAANFLVNAGDCFVVLGLARERVEALVGLANSEFAEEIEAGAGAAKADPQASRRRYASQYLEKLIQVEINVPTAAPEALLRVIGVEAKEPVKTVAMANSPARKQGPLRLAVPASLVLAAAAALLLAWRLPVPAPPPADAPATSNPQPAAPASQPSPSADNLKPAPSAEAFARAALTISQMRGQSGHDPWTFLPWGLLAIIGSGILAALLLRPRDILVRNSPAYKEAVKKWVHLIVSRRSTPRTVKQFGNMARYAAMMMRQPEERKVLSGEVRMLDRIRGKKARGGRSADVPLGAEIEARDRCVVALAAIRHAAPELLQAGGWLFDKGWRNEVKQRIRDLDAKLDNSVVTLDENEQASVRRQRDLLHTIEQAMPQPWPPGDLRPVDKFFRYVMTSFTVAPETSTTELDATRDNSSPAASQ
jgi:hypothetical protein